MEADDQALNGGVPNYGHKIIRAYCKTIIVTLFPIHDLEKKTTCQPATTLAARFCLHFAVLMLIKIYNSSGYSLKYIIKNHNILCIV